jgi:hypothetical protein
MLPSSAVFGRWARPLLLEPRLEDLLAARSRLGGAWFTAVVATARMALALLRSKASSSKGTSPIECDAKAEKTGSGAASVDSVAGPFAVPGGCRSAACAAIVSARCNPDSAAPSMHGDVNQSPHTPTAESESRTDGASPQSTLSGTAAPHSCTNVCTGCGPCPSAVISPAT